MSERNADKNMLVAVIDGHIQLFNIDNIKYEYFTENVDANEHSTFHDLHLAYTGANYLHILCMGLLDKCQLMNMIL